MHISIDISIDIPVKISMDILVNTGGAVAGSSDHAKGAVCSQRMLPKRGRAVARSRSRAVMLIAWEAKITENNHNMFLARN